MPTKHQITGWITAAIIYVWGWTIRVRFVNDPRPALRAAGKGGTLAFLHAHQFPALMGMKNQNSMALVSRSRDGDLIAAAMRIQGIHAARGSSGKHGRNKGGAVAFLEMSKFVKSGRDAYIAVDGPLGPRNRVHPGIGRLAIKHETPVIPVVFLASRRWITTKSWDRTQIPKPFSRITIHYGDPIESAGRTTEELAALTEAALHELEARLDPAEHEACKSGLRERAD